MPLRASDSKIIIAALIFAIGVMLVLYISASSKLALQKKEIDAQDNLIKRYEQVHQDMSKLLSYGEKMK